MKYQESKTDKLARMVRFLRKQEAELNSKSDIKEMERLKSGIEV